MNSPERYLVIDLETIPDPDLPYMGPPPKDGEQKTPAPIHCKIVSATGLLLRADYTVAAFSSFTNEAEALCKNIGIMTRLARQLTVVTFAGRFFDMPVLAARAFVHGIPFPRYYEGRTRETSDIRYRYAADAHLDLLDYLSDYGESRRARMDAYARACGFPGKGDVDGSKVADMVAGGRIDDVVRYNREDVVQETAVFLRTQLMRDNLSPDGYRRAMGEFIDWVGNQPGLSTLHSQIDRERALHVHVMPQPIAAVREHDLP